MLPATLRRAQRNPQRIADRAVRSGLVIRSSSALSRAYISMDARYPLPSWPANTHPTPPVGHRLRDGHDPEHDDLYWRSYEIINFQVPGTCICGECGNAGREDRRYRRRPHARLTKPRASGGNTRHSIRHRRHRRDGPIKISERPPDFRTEPPAGRARPIRPRIAAVRPIATGRSGR